MIRITFHKNNCKRVMGYSIHGHAGTATKGKDLVCCAVSVLHQHTKLGLTKMCPQVYATEDHDGHAEIWHFKENLSLDAITATQALLKTLLNSYKKLALDHPNAVEVVEITHQSAGLR